MTPTINRIKQGCKEDDRQSIAAAIGNAAKAPFNDVVLASFGDRASQYCHRVVAACWAIVLVIGLVTGYAPNVHV